ncbi:hypothetical protein [Burkholderia orbicola]|uniref:hypothetical protein n=1 Tax=Burkholderia orbicola TaxID=2978683 RepID=UPI002653CFDE|nr:hypothetical protein [Burkholderia orbicola]MDN7558221.1 hypothetical protein [Burkholderia orbicola]
MTILQRLGGVAGVDVAALQKEVDKLSAELAALDVEFHSASPLASMIAALFDRVDGVAQSALDSVAIPASLGEVVPEAVPLSLGLPIDVAYGGTGAIDAAAARANLGAAASGANSDITSLSGLTTPLSVSQGGTGDSTLTQHGVLLGQGTGAITAVPIGTAGRVLTDNGPGVDPSFAALPSQAGRLLAVRPLANGVYTGTTGTNFVLVRFSAPGGAGGGTPATSAGQSAAAGGGGAGAYVEAWFPISVLNGQTVNLGTAGTGVSAGAGNAGSTATFGTAISAPGGTGGNVASALSAPGLTAGSGTTAAATVTGGTTLLSIPGIGGDAGLVFTAGTLSESGRGGNSPVGMGGQPRPGTGANVGSGYGFGGGGANAGASQGAQTGSSGGAGWGEVWEFA